MLDANIGTRGMVSMAHTAQLQPHSFSFLSPTPEPASGVVVVVLLLMDAYYSPEGLVPYVCLLLTSAIS